MKDIPKSALWLGLAGVVPFAVISIAPLATDKGNALELTRAFLSLYSVTILAFMSGCIWAFSTRDNDHFGYALSTLPALYGCFVPFFPVFLGWITPDESLVLLALGFVILLALDRRAARRGQTPEWWLTLRVLLTILVVIFLMIGALI